MAPPIASYWAASEPTEKLKNSSVGCVLARSSNQASRDRIQVISSGSTSLSRSHRQASMPVLPPPMTTYPAGFLVTLGRSLMGIKVTSGAMEKLGVWVDGTAMVKNVASTSFL